VRERTALFAGLADATISHDETWWYLLLGRSLERIDMSARLLEGRLLAGDDTPDWLTLLRAAGAMESFLRASVQVASPEEIASFLLLDRDFPRSAYYSLAVADRCLDELSKVGPSDRDVNQARLTIRLTQTRLEYMDPSAALRELAEILDLLEQTSAAANDQITERYFRNVVAINWASGQGT
jgi:uncharacterized alpha-E superfamily protein